MAAIPDALRITGFASGDGSFAQVDPSQDAIRTSLRPIEHVYGNVAGGHYSLNAQTGTMAAAIASAAQVFQVRFAGSGLFVLERLRVQCATLTGFAALGLGCPLQLFVGHGSSANGSGGAAVAPNSLSNRMRSSMAPTQFATAGEIRVATTAALVAATSQTLEPAPVGGCMGASNQTLVQTGEMNLFDQRDFGRHPLILAPGDTLAVLTLNPAATGTWVATFTMDWLEVAAF